LLLFRNIPVTIGISWELAGVAGLPVSGRLAHIKTKVKIHLKCSYNIILLPYAKVDKIKISS